MGSRNAFANGDMSPQHSTNGIHQDLSRKHSRLEHDAVASIYSQISNTDTALEVDHMILDYVAYQATEACLTSRNPERRLGAAPHLSSSLAMVDAFLSIFKARHPSYKSDPELRLRLLLLKVATLFTQRLTSNPATPSKDALQALRASNQDRARQWIGEASRLPSALFNIASLDEQFPIAEQNLTRNRALVLRQLGSPPEDHYKDDAFYGTSACVSLLDLVPLFMQLSAARNAMSESKMTPRWMQLASDIMLQACLEQYLVFGADGTDVLDEAFAWGYKPSENSARSANSGPHALGDPETELKDMFEDEDYETEVAGWDECKAACLRAMFPVDAEISDSTIQGSIVGRLEKVATQHPIMALEMQLLTFLTRLSESVAKPVLVQLEHGLLPGLTQQETDDFLAECAVCVDDLNLLRALR